MRQGKMKGWHQNLYQKEMYAGFAKKGEKSLILSKSRLPYQSWLDCPPPKKVSTSMQSVMFRESGCCDQAFSVALDLYPRGSSDISWDSPWKFFISRIWSLNVVHITLLIRRINMTETYLPVTWRNGGHRLSRRFAWCVSSMVKLDPSWRWAKRSRWKITRLVVDNLR